MTSFWLGICKHKNGVSILVKGGRNRREWEKNFRVTMQERNFKMKVRFYKLWRTLRFVLQKINPCFSSK